ncbi:MAG: glycosyltransferase [Bacteroidetes bacterium]|nr:glycosyltransferase [Bacteroidota bacterium]
MLQSLSQISRYKNWWKYTAAPLFGVAYFMLFILGFYAHDSLRIVVRLFLSITGFASLGYFLNDWADAEADRKASKQNKVATLHPSLKFLIVSVFTILALAPWVFFQHYIYSISLISAELILFITYSFSPFRLKAKTLIAPLADALYSHVIPAVLFVGILFLINQRSVDLVFISMLVIWKICSGIRYYLNHVALDRENDLVSNHSTLATEHGNSFVYRLASKYFLPVEFSTLILFMLYAGVNFNSYAFLFLPVALFVFFLEPILTATFRFTYNFQRISLDDFYQQVFPLLSIIMLCLVDRTYVMLLVAHLFLFHRLLERTWLLLKFIYNWLNPLAGFVSNTLIFKPASFLVNYSIYYFRKIVLRHNEEQARGLDYERHIAYEKAKAAVKLKSDTGRIAVVNIHERKYTETFIYKMLGQLPFETHYLYGGDLPKYFDGGEPLLSNDERILNWLNFLETVLKKPKNFFLKKAIVRYLIKNKIELLLAEYGPVGVQMMEIAKYTGIPMVVNFHGYDVYHQKIKDEYNETYKELFKNAVAFIAVSRQMKEELISMGAEGKKIIYQPAFVDLDLFQYHDVSKNAPVFLSVGRFSETKSPHLTILAFEKVLQKIPEAKLIMIGKDGGGELFEACKILVRSLQMENKVEFKEILSPAEVYAEMKKAKVFVQHSVTTPINKDKEGTPIAVLEAMATGLPVVSTRHGGIAEVITENETGFLVNEYDVEEMANAMMRLVTDNNLVFETGKRASESIHLNPLFKNYTENLTALLKQHFVRK